MNRNTASLLLIAAAAMWGSGFVTSKIAMGGGLLPFEIVLYRFAIGTLLTGIIFHKRLRRPTRTAIRTGVILGLLTVLTFSLEMIGLTATDASKASFLTATNTVTMPLLNLLFFKVKPTKRPLIAALAAMVGVGFLTLNNGFSRFSFWDILFLTDALTYGLNTIAIVKFAGDDDRIQISFFQFLTTALFMAVFTAFQGTGGTFTTPVVCAVLYQAIFPTVVCYILKNVAVKYISPVRATLILATESIFCTVLSALMLHETIGLHIILGSALIMTGVLLESLRTTKQ
ncbi:MAG: DMT family transporter [Clostridia bacterium]|nr:DMT family transporter [Clostridia bacterium]